MQKFIISIFCHIDDFLKELFCKDDKQCKLSQAEIITRALTGSRYFSGNFEQARIFLFEHGYIPFISKSRLNRRLHDIPGFFWHLLVSYLSMKNAPRSRSSGGPVPWPSWPVRVLSSFRGKRKRSFPDLRKNRPRLFQPIESFFLSAVEV